jgi:crotonobetainyl-CoA:carnitine CoA-transferase CaiB-like acyl-CoA transferase
MTSASHIDQKQNSEQATAVDQTPLGPYRVLDLADEKGALCGSILASMGADVIKVEPPEGCPIRSLPPFYRDTPDSEGSLVWWALNTNKRSITLALDTEDGLAVFRQLVRSAHFLVESFVPGYLSSLGLGYEQIREINPAIVFVSITPYGQTGPHSRWNASDLNIQGMGGHMYLSGDADRSPVRVGVPAAYWHGGSEGAAAAMIAHHYRQRTGRGQHVDVSMQQCVIWTLLNTTMTWQLVHRQEMRGGAVRKERGNFFYTRVIWSCRDGVVYFIPIGGGGGMSRQKSYQRFVEWMRAEGFGSDVLTAKDWNNRDMYNFTQEEYDSVAREISLFLQTKTVDEIYARAVQDRLLMAPISTIKDLLQSVQLREREFFVEVHHPELGDSFFYPGPFARFSKTPLRAPRRAPLLGEHNREVLVDELGVEARALPLWRAIGATDVESAQ